jgi:hypothetical protein
LSYTKLFSKTYCSILEGVKGIPSQQDFDLPTALHSFGKNYQLRLGGGSVRARPLGTGKRQSNKEIAEVSRKNVLQMSF